MAAKIFPERACAISIKIGIHEAMPQAKLNPDRGSSSRIDSW
jgi:hypothetical protein